MRKRPGHRPLRHILNSAGIVRFPEAQFEMDKTSISIAERMGESGAVSFNNQDYSLLELGFTPSFYHFSQATITARVAFSSAVSEEFSVGASIGGGYPGIFFASVNASYSNKYSFNAEGSSEVRTTIVSLPPPAILGDIIASLSAKRSP